MFILQYGLDPYLLNNECISAINILQSIIFFPHDFSNILANLWTKKIFTSKIAVDTNNTNNTNIINKMKNNFDKLTTNIYIKKISDYL